MPCSYSFSVTCMQMLATQKNKISTVRASQDSLMIIQSVMGAHSRSHLFGKTATTTTICTHCLLRTWAETWCWCQRSPNLAGWSPWLQRLCRHGDRQQSGYRTAGWGDAARAIDKKRAVRVGEAGRARSGDGCGWTASDADVAAVFCWACVRVCLCVCAHKSLRMCVSDRMKRRAVLSLASALCCYLAG